MGFRFELLGEHDGVRRGRCHTPHGSFETPCFAPVGTYGTVKGLTPDRIAATGTELILCNSYHLAQRPGHQLVSRLGGLHRFMGWNGPILTDSGGYQIFSMDDKCKVDDGGVTFQSVIDGNTIRLTPEKVLEIQRDLGPDITMVLDQCHPADAPPELIRTAHQRTLAWACRSQKLHQSWGGAGRGQAVFGILQGGVDTELRQQAALALAELPMDGYAIGGLSVGETKAQMDLALESAVPHLPTDKVRYLMGVGMPADLWTASRAGIDLFDCVTPTRHGRNNQAFTRDGILKMRNLKHAQQEEPLDHNCSCHTCRNFSRAYLRHLCVCGEMLAGILLTLHNIHYFQDVMADIRRRAEKP